MLASLFMYFIWMSNIMNVCYCNFYDVSDGEVLWKVIQFARAKLKLYDWNALLIYKGNMKGFLWDTVSLLHL